MSEFRVIMAILVWLAATVYCGVVIGRYLARF